MFPMLHGIVNQGAAVVSNWWEAGGATGAKVVYQPEGAGSLGVSYLDLSGNGKIATLGVAPTWDAVSGWILNGTTQYLKTGVVPNGADWTVLLKFSDAPLSIGIHGARTGATNDNKTLALGRLSATELFFQNGGYIAPTNTSTSGVIAISGNAAYLNGSPIGTAMAAWAGSNTRDFWIGGFNDDGALTFPQNCKVQAFAMYNPAITSEQVAAVSAALIAPPPPPAASVVVGFGDSITAGVGATTTSDRWVNIVSSSIANATLVNSGVSGNRFQNTVQNTVATIGGPADGNGRDTYIARVQNYSPDYVLILYGTNDVRFNDPAYTVSLFENDLSEVVAALIASGIAAQKIVIGSTPYMNPDVGYAGPAPNDAATTPRLIEYVAACAAVATANGTKYADVYQYMLDNGDNSLISADGVHPNDAGHQAIANAFLSVL